MSNHDGFGVLYGNVRVRSVETNPLTGTLTLKAAYAEGQEQKIQYEGVLYSQIDADTEGRRVAIVTELTPEELRGEKHQSMAARFQADCGLNSLDAVEEMNRRGYRLFSHFVGKSDELIVVAKGLQVISY